MKVRSLSIVVIGDELLIGQVVDTNSGDIARMIEPAGWIVDTVTVVQDMPDDIRRALDSALARSQVVIVTGGIGPTKDDITKQTLCEYFGGTLQEDPAVLENIREIFRRRGLKMNELTAEQALVPTSCRVIQNRVGTAPIMWFEAGDDRVVVSMPGVPFEMRQMFDSEVFPQLRERFPSDYVLGRRCIILAGISESAVAERLDEWESALPYGYHLAYLPRQGVLLLRLDAIGADREMMESTLNRLQHEIIEIFGDKVLADKDLTPAEILLEQVRKAGLTVSSAESCTGGNIAHSITEIAGCSDVYPGSVVTYSNKVKINVLGVGADTIEKYHVVSEPVAAQMAEGVCRALGTTCAVATSGIAGPGGAVPGKPVGTVCFGATVRRPNGSFNTITATRLFPGTRDRVIDRATTEALIMLAKHIHSLCDKH